MTFHDLQIGETFAFYPARVSRLRVLPCRKISPRGYTVRLREGGITVEHIASIHTPVYQEGLTGISYEV